MDLSIRQGETLSLTITVDDSTADTLRFLAENDDGDSIDETVNFADVDGVRTAVVETNDTNIPTGDYEYMLTITYDGGIVEKLPDSDCESDDCTLPTLTICEALDVGVS